MDAPQKCISYYLRARMKLGYPHHPPPLRGVKNIRGNENEESREPGKGQRKTEHVLIANPEGPYEEKCNPRLGQKREGSLSDAVRTIMQKRYCSCMCIYSLQLLCMSLTPAPSVLVTYFVFRKKLFGLFSLFAFASVREGLDL